MIFRQYSCYLNKLSCANFLQAVAACGAEITSGFTISRPQPKVAYTYTMFFMLKFKNQKDLDEFHAMGFETKETENAKPC
jgi:hypothetical protein